MMCWVDCKLEDEWDAIAMMVSFLDVFISFILGIHYRGHSTLSGFDQNSCEKPLLPSYFVWKKNKSSTFNRVRCNCRQQQKCIKIRVPLIFFAIRDDDETYQLYPTWLLLT